MNPKFLLLMSFLSFFGCGKKAPEYPADTLTTRDGTQITLTFFKHASLAIEAGGKYKIGRASCRERVSSPV